MKNENQIGEQNVQAWIDGVKPEHSSIVSRIDKLIREVIPEIRCTTKWHKPSQPLGVPFYGLPDKGWMIALWSFKDSVGIGFIAGTLLHPEPPVTKMAGPWNRAIEYKARRIDIHNDKDFDEKLIRSWLKQALELPGWSKID
ncbi:hypothetical protein FEDK69T_24990 [Flavobacterium enshiense DK69]|uniref:YdhG-like domain-containing protein n=1 Tax=Flavobacterium enshiense DK69 TaxID=1107311 RepID=V6S592_9FLAO|nr:hypothetical protein FEDK69T_24990 [Flavobacterium enshiense DK69]KGO97062.1 hypothetical protein Q767_00200 [Flavobacterium enshiense DK69]